MSSIFISYRRADSPDAVARIHERLVQRLRNREIFYDHKSIDLAADFPEVLRHKVTSAGVVLVVIGPKWVELLLERRTAPIDHVREEIRLALAGKADVIPVLVGNAPMPGEADLQEFPELLPLLRKNAQSIGPDPDFETECGQLIAYLERTGPTEIIGSMLVGKYKVQRQIGEGGMGDVYLAEQVQPVRRLVAIKLIKAGMDSKEILARFDAERQALAVMDHPNVCKVLDAGLAPNGRPFFAMEYVKGVPITKFCDDRKLPPRDRLELFMVVCKAVQHAHQKGIIHRDIKPGNILVEAVDGRPVPKVIDFGLAKALGQKLTDRSFVATEFGKWVGTLEYSSPEQAEGRFDIDTLSDVYSLGVLLYELLVGSPPFARDQLLKASENEMRRVIKEVEPAKPSSRLSSSVNLTTIAANRQLDPAKLTRQVRGELDWIVTKALEKEPKRRYASADTMAECVRLYLGNEPIPGLRPTLTRKIAKFARRNRNEFKFVARILIGMVTLFTLTLSTWVLLADADKGVPNGQNIRDWLDEHNYSVMRSPPTEMDIMELVRQKKQMTSESILSLRNREGMFISEVDRPKSWDEWTQCEMAAGLYSLDTLSQFEKAILTDTLIRLQQDETRFTKGRGWKYHNGYYTLESVAWALSALSRAIKFDGSDAGKRAVLIGLLGNITDILDAASHKKYGRPGGWGMLTHETGKTDPDLYVTAIVLQGLLDMRLSGLGWRDNIAIRDQYLQETADYMIRLFTGTGWKFTDAAGKHEIDAGNALLFAILLRSHLEAGIQLPQALVDQIQPLLLRVAKYPTDYPMSNVFFSSEYREMDGTIKTYEVHSVKLPWLPYTLSLAAMYKRYCTQYSSDTRAMRRAIISLLNMTDSQVIRFHIQARYVEAEMLYALSYFEGV